MPRRSIMRKHSTTSIVLICLISWFPITGKIYRSKLRITWTVYFSAISLRHFSCHSRAIFSKVYAVRTFTRLIFCPSASFRFCSSRHSRACTRLNRGYAPSVSVCGFPFSPLKENRHTLDPFGLTHNASPPPSASLYSLSLGLAFFTWAAVSGVIIFGIFVVQGKVVKTYHKTYHKKTVTGSNQW